jgi:DNA modification methylase
MEPVTRPGDLWQFGPHRLLCGDATNPTDFVRLMNGEQARLIVTDPSYHVDYHGKAGQGGITK